MTRLAIGSSPQGDAAGLDPDTGEAPPPPEDRFRLPLERWLGVRGSRVAMVTTVVLGLCVLVASDVFGHLRAWVHHRPVYRWSIETVVLEPSPPAWVRTGREGLVASAAPALKRFEGGSTLDLDLEAVERAFKNLLWVEEVHRVRRSYPNRVAVELEYRQPSAFVQFKRDGPTDPGVRYYLDRHGVILGTLAMPGDLDVTALPTLIRLVGLNRPHNGNPGTTWDRPPNEAEDDDSIPRIDRTAVASASLARFLLDRVAVEGWPSTPGNEVIAIDHIQPLDPTDRSERMLYLFHRRPDGRELWVLWRSAPGAECPGEPSAEEKWRMFVDWVNRGGPDQPLGPGCLDFTLKGPRWLPEAGSGNRE